MQTDTPNRTNREPDICQDNLCEPEPFTQEQPSLDQPFLLDPIDQHVLEQTGSLPGLDLLINPELLARLRDPPPSVHTIETSDRTHRSTVDSMDSDEYDPINADNEQREDYTFRGYLLKPRMDAYVRAVEIYSTIDQGFGGKYSSRLQNCRKVAWFVQHKVTKKLRVMSSRCKLRWCPICRDVSRMIVTNAVDEWLLNQKYPKMITLTLKHNDDPLQLQIKRLYDCFRKLRRRAYFQRLITGGVWFFQLTLNLHTEQWHVHVHCLVAGKYLPHSRLKSLWKEITGDSKIVDIRPVRDLESASSEVARYATSPADITRMSFENSLDVYYSTKGRRICGSWGTAKSVALKPTPQDDQDDWCKVADFYFINVQKQYSKTAQEFWKCYKRDKPYDGPRVQDERDVFEDELKILMSVEDMPETYQQFASRVLRNRSGPWANFFKEKG